MSPEARLARGARWFYWVAALSLLNAVLMASGQEWKMVMGLSLTDIICAMPQILHGKGPLGAPEIAFILSGNVLVAGFVAGFGYLSLKRHTWAFILGAVLYMIDAIPLVLLQDWYSLAFHAFVLYQFFNGIKACFDLKKPPSPSEGAA
jgi:hypothetical protein